MPNSGHQLPMLHAPHHPRNLKYVPCFMNLSMNYMQMTLNMCMVSFMGIFHVGGRDYHRRRRPQLPSRPPQPSIDAAAATAPVPAPAPAPAPATTTTAAIAITSLSHRYRFMVNRKRASSGILGLCSFQRLQMGNIRYLLKDLNSDFHGGSVRSAILPAQDCKVATVSRFLTTQPKFF